MAYKYIDGSDIKIGDVFTDGSRGSEDIRLKNRAKVLYIDRYNLVWFPLNDFTTHSQNDNNLNYKSNTWCLSSEPKKIELEELTDQELKKYHESDSYLKNF